MIHHRIILVAAVAMIASFGPLAGQLRILEPESNTPAYTGQSVLLVARWDGSSGEGLEFRWSSNVDGMLASGLESSVEALSYASHQISVEAVRGDSVLGRAQTVVHVIGTPEQFTLSERIDWEGEFSPSGRRVAYSSYRSGDPEVWVADVENRYAERITFSGGRAPVWNPDGTHLVFWSERAGGRDLWLVDLAQKPREAVRLTDQYTDDWMPAFHSLEPKVAYIAKRDRQLRLMVLEIGPVDTTAAEVVGPEHYPMFPRWSGDDLLFTSFADSVPSLMKYMAATGALVEVGPAGCEEADISRDGSRVLTVRDGELYLLSTSGGALRPLTHESAGVLNPRFSPDGASALFATTRSGNFDLWLLSLPPGL